MSEKGASQQRLWRQKATECSGKGKDKQEMAAMVGQPLWLWGDLGKQREARGMLLR